MGRKAEKVRVQCGTGLIAEMSVLQTKGKEKKRRNNRKWKEKKYWNGEIKEEKRKYFNSKK